jgi:hypothetical protein
MLARMGADFTGGDTAVRLSLARPPVPRDSVAVRVLEFASGFVLVVFG